VVDSKGWIFKKSKPGKVQGRHLSLALRALLYCQDVYNNNRVLFLSREERGYFKIYIKQV
jgi:hypothetical protein